VCKISLLECNSRVGDSMGANSYAHSLSHSPWEFPTPHAQILRHLGLPLLVLGCGLKTTYLYILLLSEVPRPEASTPLPGRLLLCHLLHGYHYPWDQEGTPLWLRPIHGAEPGRHPRPVNARDHRPQRNSLLSCSTSSGFLARGPTVLTLVNARGPYGT